MRINKTSFRSSKAVFHNELSESVAVIRETQYKQNHRLSSADKEKIVIGYTKEKLSIYQLAGRFGCHRNTVSNLLKKHGIAVTRNRMDDITIKEAALLYAKGLTIKEVAQQLGLVESTVGRTLRNAGVAMREPHRYR